MKTGTSPSSLPGRTPRASGYRSFWDGTGLYFPSLTHAASTDYYFQCERYLFERFLPDLEGKKVFKTDLWDEAKNSHILKWARDQGAETFGLDISSPIVEQARSLFAGLRTGYGFVVSDLRDIAFRDESFDYVYSMGTCEHFPEYTRAIKECYRVLKRGGVAVMGVPNKGDVFLRPLMVTVLQRLGLYAYGAERSFSMKAWEGLLRGAGFRVVGRSGILFMPGWLRMADLLLHVNWPWARWVMKPLITPFAWLYRRSDLLKRQGYLIACAVQKP